VTSHKSIFFVSGRLQLTRLVISFTQRLIGRLLAISAVHGADYAHSGAMRWSRGLGSPFFTGSDLGTSTTNSMTIHEMTVNVMLDNAKTTAARPFLVRICFRRSCFGSKLFQSAWRGSLDTKPNSLLPWLRHCSMPRSLRQTEHIFSYYK
jgi:hypothetical protein